MATKYYDTSTALDYKVLLRHFKDQSKGSNKAIIIPKSMLGPASRWGMTTSSLVIVDRVKPDTTDVTGHRVPAIEVVDPSEASKRRAASELQYEYEEESGTQEAHSSAGSDRRHKRQRAKKRGPAPLPREKVKRAKDVFDT